MTTQQSVALMNTYLDQQRVLSSSIDTVSVSGSTSTINGPNAMVIANEDTITLDEFKNYVRKWLELDNFVKKAQEVVKEKKKARDEFSKVITKFMCKYNIEDLNTKEGRIRCKVGYVKAPVNQKLIKQRISDYFSNEEEKKQEILSKIYDERNTAEKVTLRRLKIS
jgi:hypothetical protein